MSIVPNLDTMTDEEKLAALESIQQSIRESKDLQKQKIAKNVDLVMQGIKKIEADIRARFEGVGTQLEKRISNIKDGRDGADGRDGKDGEPGKPGKDGKDGRPGRDGKDGVNGVDGQDGVSVVNVFLDFDNSLVVELSDGRQINAGEVLPPDIADRLKVVINQGASGGGGGASLPDQTGNAGKYLTTDGTSASWATVAGGISSVASADGSVTVTTVSGAVDLSVATASSTTNLVVQVRNTTGATLTKGTAVYISGATGQISTVTKAQANADSTSAQTLGLVNANISNNANGYVTVIGLITNIDTSAYTDGQQLYLSGTTAGGLTATKPYAPTHLVYVAVVEHAHPTQGKLFVKVQNGYEMDELHNVSAQNATNGQILIYNETTSLWEKANITAGSNITVTNAAGSITIASTASGGSGDGGAYAWFLS